MQCKGKKFCEKKIIWKNKTKQKNTHQTYERMCLLSYTELAGLCGCCCFFFSSFFCFLNRICVISFVQLFSHLKLLLYVYVIDFVIDFGIFCAWPDCSLFNFVESFLVISKNVICSCYKQKWYILRYTILWIVFLWWCFISCSFCIRFSTLIER